MRYLRIRGWLAEVLANSGGIGAAYFEEMRRRAGVDAAHAYGGFLALATAWCEQSSIPYSGVPVGATKKYATGTGNAGRTEPASASRLVAYTAHRSLQFIPTAASNPAQRLALRNATGDDRHACIRCPSSIPNWCCKRRQPVLMGQLQRCPSFTFQTT
jgi:hypothetical protein